MSANLIELLREVFSLEPQLLRDIWGNEFVERGQAALAQAEAQPKAEFTMEQFGGLVGLARDHATERSVVYKATNHYGETCHFGVSSLAQIWARHGGKVEEVLVRDLRVVTTPNPVESAVPSVGWRPLIQALAAIDDALGIEQDGRNSTEVTLDTIKELREQAARGEALARAVMADHVAIEPAAPAVPAALIQWANRAEDDRPYDPATDQWSVGYDAARAWVRMQIAAPEVK